MRTTLTDRLTRLGACNDAVAWARGRTAARAWRECEDGSWMLWIAGRLSGPPGSRSRRLVVRAAAACARTALPYAREEFLLAVLLALHICEEYVAGRADEEDCRAAAEAAWAARATGATAGAARAAWAGVAAAWAGVAARAAEAAAWAGVAAAWAGVAAAWARIVRRIIPYREIARLARRS